MVVFLCWCGGVLVVVCLWWCSWVVFLCWCSCAGVFVVVFLKVCSCSVLVVVFLWCCGVVLEKY